MAQVILQQKILKAYHSKITYLYSIVLLLCSNSIISQDNYIGVNSVYDDSFVEWTIYISGQESANEVMESQMTVRFPNKGEWSEWQISHQDYYTDIRQKWKNRAHNFIATSYLGEANFYPRFTNDLTEWKILYDDKVYIWSSEYKNDLNLWYYDDKKNALEMETVYENDVRDWNIFDEAPEINALIKDVFLFITTYVTSPKE